VHLRTSCCAFCERDPYTDCLRRRTAVGEEQQDEPERDQLEDPDLAEGGRDPPGRRQGPGEGQESDGRVLVPEVEQAAAEANDDQAPADHVARPDGDQQTGRGEQQTRERPDHPDQEVARPVVKGLAAEQDEVRHGEHGHEDPPRRPPVWLSDRSSDHRPIVPRETSSAKGGCLGDVVAQAPPGSRRTRPLRDGGCGSWG